MVDYKVIIVCLLILLVTAVLTPYNYNYNNNNNKFIEKFDELSLDCQAAISNNKIASNTAVSNCLADKQQIQVLLDGKTTEVTNYKNMVSDCTKQKNDAQMAYDKVSVDYKKLMDQIILQQKNTNSTNNQVTVLQDNLSKCQQHVNDNNNRNNDIQNQYNQLVQNYQKLQDAYKKLFEEYSIKCYDYHIKSRTTAP